jgi:GNAT superfamily N-acetyltransferase
LAGSEPSRGQSCLLGRGNLLRAGRSLAQSLCVGLVEDTRQIGLARVITDRRNFGDLGDVSVLEEFRGEGLGRWLMQTVGTPHASRPYSAGRDRSA